MVGCRLLTALVSVSLLFGMSALNQTADDGPLVEFLPARMDELLLRGMVTIYVKATAEMTGCRRLSCAMANTDIAEFVFGGEVTICAKQASNATHASNATLSLVLYGRRMGRTVFECQIEDIEPGTHNESGWMPLKIKYLIAVVRETSVLDKFFTPVISVIVVCTNICMGCAIDLDVIKAVLKRPVAPTIAFLSQFLAMPLVSNVSSHGSK